MQCQTLGRGSAAFLACPLSGTLLVHDARHGPSKGTPDFSEPQHRSQQGLTPVTATRVLLNPHKELTLCNQKRQTPNRLNIIYVHLWLLHNNSKDCSYIRKYIRVIRHFSEHWSGGRGPALPLNSRTRCRRAGLCPTGWARPAPATRPDHAVPPRRRPWGMPLALFALIPLHSLLSDDLQTKITRETSHLSLL